MVKKVAAGVLAASALAITPMSVASAQNILQICPRGYYGVEVYDPQGNTIAYACVRG